MTPPSLERWIARVGADMDAPQVAMLGHPEHVLPLEEGVPSPPPGATVEVYRTAQNTAHIIRVLAQPDTARSALYDLLEEHGVRVLFPAAVLAETEALVESPGLDDPELLDWTALPFVTIDNDNSRDLDQALYLVRHDGGYRFCYALADAAYYVRPGTALFEEALARGSSYYLPGMSVPMLPRALSEGLVSLNAEQHRRALVFEALLGPLGETLQARFVRARIRSRRKLTYKGVQAFHDAGCAGPLAHQEFTDSLVLMGELGELLMARADERNVIRFDRTSAHITLADDGNRFLPVLERRNRVERWNEQLSLLCNMEGSRLLSVPEEPHVQPIFKVHPRPSASQLQTLQERLDALVEVLGLESRLWSWDGAEPLADYIARLPRSPQTARLRAAVERQAMLLGSASSFSLEKGPHFGLAADEYGRFSSPMREIVGIFTHKEL
ncbi:MAG: RNB domain-containing ribonuclease, partial [Myxococcota bacterium]